jgi:hypothetical protein
VPIWASAGWTSSNAASAGIVHFQEVIISRVLFLDAPSPSNPIGLVRAT